MLSGLAKNILSSAALIASSPLAKVDGVFPLTSDFFNIIIVFATDI
jgi:hypothetical protein